MGLLLNGEWKDQWYDTRKSAGEFIREDSQFHGWITAASPTTDLSRSEFPAEPDRYHLFVSLACPWAHRTLIFRSLKKLKDVISVSIVDPKMLDKGWTFAEPDQTVDPYRHGFRYLYQVYIASKPDYSGRVTIPVLWDKKTDTIVNNESSEIIRMLNSAFNDFTPDRSDFYPEAYRAEIDAINGFVYHHINNGVYRCGFATTQEAYETAFRDLFKGLDELESRLSGQRYLIGDRITEADWRLFTTLIRFDAVYHGHFKANLKRIRDYTHLFNYLLELYQYPGVRETVNFDHIKTHYYYSHDTINPTRIIPVGPEMDLDQPHNRGLIGVDS